ncbi:hypothetical protein PSTG_08766 [Puccinia striiformis f. sp. tritici PST-78]|uniref:Uncharacterized protein n=1 Tax=Puccinia striiformis f. sp. tritici PST-78 TaxID=1165861 RepID=A0A0L0VFR7_9BASI|nr:hypothetical protein PSTG_08766 [Puccinia striiformis f. sp. tritici PST-78]
MALILEIGPDGHKHFNVFDAAPENERDGPQQQMQLQQRQQQLQMQHQQNNGGQDNGMPNPYVLPQVGYKRLIRPLFPFAIGIQNWCIML